MTFLEFKQKYGLLLTEQQEKAVQAINGPVLLLAVPGSGKTTVLIDRIGYMVLSNGINPEQILALTYTTKATENMNQRFKSKFGLNVNLQFRTINSLSLEIVNYYSKIEGRKPFNTIDNSERNRIIKYVYKNNSEESFPTESQINELGTIFSFIKNMMLTDDEIKELDCSSGVYIYGAYKDYKSKLLDLKLMDFDDQMVYALMVLKKYPNIKDYYQERFKYICVDEAQDTSKIQHEIIKILAQKYNNIFMVGDEDQSIYGFRAAYPQALLLFDKEYKNSVILKLEENFRSTKSIVSVAEDFISINKNRYYKRMLTNREIGKSINTVLINKRSSQYSYLEKVAINCNVETAVLYRNNESALPIIDRFERNNISYNLSPSDGSFFTSPLVTDICNILKFSLKQTDSDLFLQVYYKLNAKINKNIASEAANKAKKKKTKPLDEIINSNSSSKFTINNCVKLKYYLNDINDNEPYKAILTILKMGYREYLKTKDYGENKIDILLSIAASETSVHSFLSRLNYLEKLMKAGKNNRDANIDLLTIHAAKGLEFSRVFIIDAIEGILPNTSLNEGNNITDIEEERRIFYVAMTRAKNELIIFNYDDYDAPFVDDIENIINPGARVHVSKINTKNTEDYNNLSGQTIYHKTFGKGKIISRKGDVVTVKFNNGLKKDFLYDFSVLNGIIK